MEKNIPILTAQEHFKQYFKDKLRTSQAEVEEWANIYAIAKAKYYVQQALIAASEKAEIVVRTYLEQSKTKREIDKESILNSYSFSNIK